MTVTVEAPQTRFLRPLPRPVRPVRDETVASFLHRLASANRLDAEELRCYIAADRHKRVCIPLDRLAVLSGQSCVRLRRTIYEYRSPDNDARPVRPPVYAPERIACSLCTARHGVQGVIVRLHVEDLVCQRHARWLGNIGVAYPQVSLASTPEISAANRRHRRIIRYRGRRAAYDAFEEAQRICAAWRRRVEHEEDFQSLLHRFHPYGSRVLEGDPSVEATAYPQAVALTRLLASPSARELPFTVGGIERFADEVRRTVASRFRWSRESSYGRCDPLIDLYIDEAHTRHAGDPPRSRIFATPERPVAPWMADLPDTRPRCWE